MLDLGSSSFVISPHAAKAFSLRGIIRITQVKTAAVTGRQIVTEGLFTIPLVLSFGNHRSYDQETHTFEVITT